MPGEAEPALGWAGSPCTARSAPNFMFLLHPQEKGNEGLVCYLDLKREGRW